MKTLVESTGCKFAIVFVPFRVPVHEGSGEREASIEGTTAVKNWAQQNRVPLLDVGAALDTRPVLETLLRDRSHFDSLGHQLIGDDILQNWQMLNQSLQPTGANTPVK
jgi:hypothetical protein